MNGLLLTLLAAVGLGPQPSPGFGYGQDTPASDVIRLGGGYSLAKDHSLGPTAPTVVVEPSHPVPYLGIARGWPTIDGIPNSVIRDDAQRVAISGNWLVVQDQQGMYQIIDLRVAKRDFADGSTSRTILLLHSLDAVNGALTQEHTGPVSDADFRTFEELVAERERRRVTWSLAGVAAGVAPLAMAVLVVLRRRAGIVAVTA